MLGAQVGLPLPTAVASQLPPAWAPAGRTSPSAGQACLCPISGDTCLLRGDREDPSESFLPSFAVGQVRGGGDTQRGAREDDGQSLKGKVMGDPWAGPAKDTVTGHRAGGLD